MEDKNQTKDEAQDNSESQPSDTFLNSSPDSHQRPDKADTTQATSHSNSEAFNSNLGLVKTGKAQDGITLSPQLNSLMKQVEKTTKPLLVNQFSAPPSLPSHTAFTEIQKIQSVVGDTTQSKTAFADIMRTQAALGDTVKSNPTLAGIMKTQAALGDTVKSNPTLAGIMKTQAALGDTVKSNPVLADIMKTQAALGDTVKSNPALADIMKTQATIGETFKSNPAFIDALKKASSLYSNPDIVKRMQELQGSHFNTFKDLYDENTHASISDSLKSAAELKSYSFEESLKNSSAFRNDVGLPVNLANQTNDKIDTTNERIETSNRILTEVGNALNKITFSVGSMEESALKMSAQNEKRHKIAQEESEQRRSEDSRKYRVQNWVAIIAIASSALIGLYQIYSSSITEKTLIDELKQSNTHLQKIVDEQQSIMLQLDRANQSIGEASLLSKEALEMSKQNLSLTEDSYEAIDSLKKTTSNANSLNQYK